MQRLLAEANHGVPFVGPTTDEINRMAAQDEERFTEGRQRRPSRPNPHD